MNKLCEAAAVKPASAAHGPFLSISEIQHIIINIIIIIIIMLKPAPAAHGPSLSLRSSSSSEREHRHVTS